MKKQWLAGLLVGVLCLNNSAVLPVSAETEETSGENDMIVTTETTASSVTETTAATEENDSTSGLENWELIESDRYTGNMGDSFIDQIGTRNGYTTVDDVTYSGGFEIWIARWNYSKEKSWAWATYALDSSAQTFAGTLSVLSESPNATNYDTTIEILLDDEMVYSYRMTPGFTPQDIHISLEGASTITISVYDNEETSCGTSFCIGTEVSSDSVLYGDINLDGKISIIDAVLLNKATNGSVTLNEQARKNADCNANGELDADDAITLLKFLVHLIDSLPG
ncbi:MAG: dockerin type I repeat-containing protein [Ruminococcus sp.]